MTVVIGLSLGRWNTAADLRFGLALDTFVVEASTLIIFRASSNMLADARRTVPLSLLRRFTGRGSSMLNEFEYARSEFQNHGFHVGNFYVGNILWILFTSHKRVEISG